MEHSCQAKAKYQYQDDFLGVRRPWRLWDGCIALGDYIQLRLKDVMVFCASVVVSVAMMENVEDFAAWIEESDRELKAWLEVEAEEERLISSLVEQTEIDPLEAFR